MIFDRIAVFAGGVTPALALLGYGVLKLRADWRNEALWTAFFTGAVGALGAAIVEFALLPLLALHHLPAVAHAAAEALFVAATPEETAKFAVLVTIALTHVDARRQQDTILLALAVSLGFAALENLFYVAAPHDWTSIALARASTAVPSHGIDGLAMGAFVTAARLGDGRRKLRLALALVVPIVLHAAYDFPMMALKQNHALKWPVPVWLAVVSVSIVFVVWLCRRVVRRAAAADRLSGRDRGAAGSNIPLIAGGAGFVAAGLLIGTALAMTGTPSTLKSMLRVVVPIILPTVLGIDLVRTGLRHPRITGDGPVIAPQPSRAP